MSWLNRKREQEVSHLHCPQEPKLGTQDYIDAGSRRPGFPTRLDTFGEGNFSIGRLQASLLLPSASVTRVDAIQAAFSVFNLVLS